jgi:transcriptional regulator with XRE-family HTH domain
MKWYDLAKSLMKRDGINQEQLAEHLGITKGGKSLAECQKRAKHSGDCKNSSVFG